MKRLVCLIGLVLGLAVLVLLLRRADRKIKTTDPSTDSSPVSSLGFKAQAPKSLDMRQRPVGFLTAERDSNLYVEVKRVYRDPDYVSNVIRKHQSIKSYLASPIKGTPELENLVDLLLANGYAIDDLLMAYIAVHAVASRSDLERHLAALRNNGADERTIMRVRNEIERMSLDSGRIRLARMLHLPASSELVDAFLAIAPEPSPPLGHASEFLPHFELVDGERILRDQDWMSPERRRLVESYQGPRRTTFGPYTSVSDGSNPLGEVFDIPINRE